ncbi:MAG: YggU family protein [Gammaproteobacteria bacterium]|nr:YggU family protein [Gammaproteobacteria bacterium]
MSFYQWQGDDLIIFIRVQPKSSKDELAEIIKNETQADQIKIRITAPPVDGKANKHLIAYLGKLFKVAKSQIDLLSGETGRNKKLLIHAPKKLPHQILNTKS